MFVRDNSCRCSFVLIKNKNNNHYKNIFVRVSSEIGWVTESGCFSVESNDKLLNLKTIQLFISGVYNV